MKNLLDLNFLFAIPFGLVGDDETVETTETETTETEEKPAPKPAPKPAKVTFTPEQQAYMNSVLAEEKRVAKAKTDKVVTQLETLRNQSGTTVAEKARLEEQIEELRNQHLTEKELAETANKKKEKAKDTEIAKHKGDAERWEKLFKTTQVKRAIVDAGTLPGQKATNPEQLVALLAPDTRLVEEIDDETGKPTGEFVAKTRVRTIKDGKPQTLDMVVTEAVKFYSEQDSHMNLFDSGAAGGLGGNPNRSRSGGGTDPNTPPEDPEAYRKWRAANPGKVGATVRKTNK